MPIRPDQAGAEPPAARPAATTPAARSNAPIPLTPNAAPARQAAQGNAPLSLSPQVANAEASAPRPSFPPVQPAAQAPVAPPARVAASPPATVGAPAGGSYVQLSAHRSEAEAQASFRSFQGKFPSILGSRQPVIQRADLGDKGVYYRAMVGGFASPDQAIQFCGSLKSAGGQCVVQRN